MGNYYDLADEALMGNLAKRLRHYRYDLGMSQEQIADAINEECGDILGFTVSRPTVRNWFVRAGIPTHRVPA